VSIDPETGRITDEGNGEEIGNIYDELGIEGP
jgi:hypothetical protein